MRARSAASTIGAGLEVEAAAPPRRPPSLATLLAGETAVLLALHLAGRARALRVPWGRHLGDWLLHQPLQVVVAALAREAALLFAWWLLASTLAYLAARLTRQPGAVRLAACCALPVVRSAADQAVALGLATTIVGSASAAVPLADRQLAARPALPPARQAARADLRPAAPPPAPTGQAEHAFAAAHAMVVARIVAAAAGPRPLAAPTQPAPSTTVRPPEWAPTPAGGTPSTATGGAPPTSAAPTPTTAAAPSTSSSTPRSAAGGAPSTSAATPPSTSRPPRSVAGGAPSTSPRASAGGGAATSTSRPPTQPRYRPKPAGLPAQVPPPTTSPSPPGNSSPGQPVAPSQGTTHRVAPGENLWVIARDHLARATGRSARALSDHDVARYWVRVMQANHGHLVSGDPNLIYPGEIVRLPPVS